MSTTSIQDTVAQVLQRLLNLETREALRETTKSTVIDALMQQNRELKQENVELKKEVIVMKKDVDGLVTKVATLESHDIQGIKNKVSKVRRQTKSLGLQFNGLSSRTQEIQGRVEYLSGLHRVLSKSLVDRQNVPDLYQKVKDLGRRIGAIDGKTQTIEQRTSSLEQETSSFVQMRDDVRQSITYAEFGQPTGGLVTRRWVRMDCVKVFGTTGIMDRATGIMDGATGCLMPKRTGSYFVGMRMCQDGYGVIHVRIRLGEEDGGHAIVSTRCDDDLRCGVYLTVMHEGQKVWFEAWRVKGNPKIGWCWVYCWFLSPL